MKLVSRISLLFFKREERIKITVISSGLLLSRPFSGILLAMSSQRAEGDWEYQIIIAHIDELTRSGRPRLVKDS